MCPELLGGARYNIKADIWSLGASYFEMITGFPPFLANDENELYLNLKRGTYKIPKQLELSIGCLGFLNSCLQF